MTDEKKPPIFTDGELSRLKEIDSDHDRHFIPKPEDIEDDSATNDK